MRQKRAKAYRKLMAMYELYFGFRQPYQVLGQQSLSFSGRPFMSTNIRLVDSGMCITAQDHKIDLTKQLETVLQGKIKPIELYKMGKERQSAVDLAKSFERRKCNHREAIEGSECLRHVVGDANKHRYVIATQAQDLRSQLRTIQAVPIVHIKMSVMILEPPSEETLRAKQQITQESLDISEKEKQSLVGANTGEPSPEVKVHRRAKGPNPLSVKRKKPRPVDPSPRQRQGSIGEPTLKRKHEGDGDGDDDAETLSPRRKRRRRKHPEPASESQPDISLKSQEQ
ncbi:hypothetical protein FRC17_009011 [Serendipita sp. 399]|nr:hypothetical protein FRC17_009011 [Serendipita sp. 399]